MRILAFLAAIAIASPAAAFRGDIGLRVTKEAGSNFTVEYKSRAQLTDYWCAAGRFVTVTMGLPDRTRVYRLSPPPRKSGEGIRFTLDASLSAGETGLTTFGGPQDGSMSAGGAFAQFCNDFDIDF